MPYVLKKYVRRVSYDSHTVFYSEEPFATKQESTEGAARAPLRASMRTTLLGLFAFLLCCAGVYYTFQFQFVQSYAHEGWQRRPNRQPRIGAEPDRADSSAKVGVPKVLSGARPRVNDRLRGLDSKLQRHLRATPQGHGDEAGATSTAAPAVAATAAAVPAVAGLAGGDAASASPLSAQCNRTRRPYHVVMTAASGLYQEWQSRIAYYHYKKQKRLHPCSDIGGFTRLFNNVNHQPDGLMDEIPTVVVDQLSHGHCDKCDSGFIVMNRPWGVLQFVETAHYRDNIPEEYIFVIETECAHARAPCARLQRNGLWPPSRRTTSTASHATPWLPTPPLPPCDPTAVSCAVPCARCPHGSHMMMRPFDNIATPEQPVGFGFYYMLGTDPKLKPVVQKFLEPGIDPATVDAVGPSPIVIHKPLLAKVARPWWDMSKRMQRDRDAQVIFGWVRRRLARAPIARRTRATQARGMRAARAPHKHRSQVPLRRGWWHAHS